MGMGIGARMGNGDRDGGLEFGEGRGCRCRRLD
jgi:hypothetical protein